MPQLSTNFSLKELTRSDTAIRKGIDNTPDFEQVINLTHLSIFILQPVRDKWGSTTVNSGLRVLELILQPVRDKWGSTTVNSGLRVLELNRAIGSSDTSQHRKGEAADIECKAVSNLELAKWIRDNLDFDQVILEAYDGVDPTSGWVHVSYRADRKNRKKCLTATFINGKAKYTNGLPE
jgi:uncharacterized protein YcbK (DUF882 family)